MTNRHRFHRAGGPRPLVLGHRGARAFEPENTLRAFSRALADGADGVELDVRMTSDGEAVICHDDDVQFAGVEGKRALSRLTASQLRELRLPSGDPIPTLRQVLLFQAETGCLMNIELKGDVPAPGCLAEVAARMIALHGGDGLVLSSFSPLVVHRLARLLPHVPVALLLDKEHGKFRHVAPLRLLGATGFHPHYGLIDEKLVKKMRRRGAFLGTWTVNDPAVAARLAALGVDVLIGDDPGLLRRAVAQNGAQ